jgi:hypothetical protein
MRFRIKSIMLVVAMVGVSIGLGISLDRAFATKDHKILGYFLSLFWGWYIWLALLRKNAAQLVGRAQEPESRESVD